MAKNLIIKTIMDTKQFDKKYNEVVKKSEALKSNQYEINDEMSLFADSMDETTSNVDEMAAGMGEIVSQMANWAIIIGNIALAMTIFKKAWNTVSERNKEVASKIETIKNSFAEMGDQLSMTLEPVIIRIVDWLYKLTQYVAYVLKAWFGIETSARNTAKSSKEIKKSMAGFDTANVLNNNGSSSNSMALKPLDDSEAPGWLRWIAEHGEEIALIIAGISAAIGILALVIGGPIMLGIEALLIAIGIIAYEVVKNWDKIKEFIMPIADWIYKNVIEPVSNFFGNYFSTLWNNIIAVIDNIKKVISFLVESIKNYFSPLISFFTMIWTTIFGIFEKFGIKIGNVIAFGLKVAINGALATVERMLNFPINAINSLLDIINAVPGINLSKLQTFNLPRIKMATGGIINNPGHGVPLGAIGGEAGREGILPLTDSQAMAELGKEIGKWINLNVNLTTKLDSRVLSKSLERVQNNNSFVRNGV